VRAIAQLPKEHRVAHTPVALTRKCRRALANRLRPMTVPLARQVLGESALSIGELFFLRNLTLAVRWAGRYRTGIKRPAPIDFMRASGTGSTDSQVVHELANRILQIHDSLK
jgi:hypothetical protein